MTLDGTVPPFQGPEIPSDIDTILQISTDVDTHILTVCLEHSSMGLEMKWVQVQ